MQRKMQIQQIRLKNMFEKPMRCRQLFYEIYSNKRPKLVNFGIQNREKSALDLNLEAKRHQVGAQRALGAPREAPRAPKGS